MSSDQQAAAYLQEAELTLRAARAIFESADASDENLWAQVVKNGYDAIEQAVSAAIAAGGEAIPRTHPGKVDTFVDLEEPPTAVEDLLLYWLRRRSDSQYVDIRGERINVPHRQFDRPDASRVLRDAETVLDYVAGRLE